MRGPAPPPVCRRGGRRARRRSGCRPPRRRSRRPGTPPPTPGPAGMPRLTACRAAMPPMMRLSLRRLLPNTPRPPPGPAPAQAWAPAGAAASRTLEDGWSLALTRASRLGCLGWLEACTPPLASATRLTCAARLLAPHARVGGWKWGCSGGDGGGGMSPHRGAAGGERLGKVPRLPRQTSPRPRPSMSGPHTLPAARARFPQAAAGFTWSARARAPLALEASSCGPGRGAKGGRGGVSGAARALPAGTCANQRATGGWSGGRRGQVTSSTKAVAPCSAAAESSAMAAQWRSARPAPPATPAASAARISATCRPARVSHPAPPRVGAAAAGDGDGWAGGWVRLGGGWWVVVGWVEGGYRHLAGEGGDLLVLLDDVLGHNHLQLLLRRRRRRGEQ
jgi:hypothetical protein